MTAVQIKEFTAEDARNAKAWPFQEAARLVKRMERVKKDGPVTFETGYGPSGLPHIGTFGEVVRTTMVRNAFRTLTDDQIPTRLICVSDDMDGMRKVPPTVPNPEALEPYLQKPLTDVPDPFGTHENYGAHMNSRLCAFLDSFGFDYEFLSATDLYKSGRYDETLLRALEKFDEIMAVMLPTLGAERQATYSPFFTDQPKNRAGALYANESNRPESRHDHIRRRGRYGNNCAGNRRASKASMEA